MTKKGVRSLPISYALIGQNIKAVRQNRQVSQEQMAEILGVSVSYLSRIERGAKKINLDRLGQISEILNTPVEYFLHGSVLSGEREASLLLDKIAEGCSPELIRTMVRVCEVIARHEKG